VVPFLRNCWYVAAWNYELTSDKILARTILNEPLAFYRTPSGKPAVLEDRCCHRSVPLSYGAVKGDTIECGYHGLRYDPTGRCVLIPGQHVIPPEMRVKTYPIVEKWQWIWVWMGDPARADEALIPNWYWMDHSDWEVARGDVFHVHADYRLFIDNILDLSHSAFLHKTTLAQSYIPNFPIQTERTESSVRMTRWMIDVDPSPFHARVKNFLGKVDRWTKVEAMAPAHILVEAGSAPTGTGAREGNRDGAVYTPSPNELTPETEKSCYAFYAHPRNFALGDETLTELIRNEMIGVFREDIWMLEGQQAWLDRAPTRPTVATNQDVPVEAMRRVLGNLIAAEQIAGDA
jgi:phenylpropionate dioxygenase-like ring-hydroxylating dioxygenase large terminal subunit